MTGVEMIKQIRADSGLSSMKVIMMSTMHDRFKVLSALKLGIQGFILKPINFKILTSKLKEIESSSELEEKASITNAIRVYLSGLFIIPWRSMWSSFISILSG
jgi:YesN/AraC family two-component response regulator